MDLYDRKIIGWSLSENMTTTDTVAKAWMMAVINRQIERNDFFIQTEEYSTLQLNFEN
ncbi:hypothetical protein QUH73_18585 [Labilibaculum sp. K2S]|uniref:hypothetical protein n=1 Tax=Labilibaculum sp. K2S TaxID=3056386 RepID=UPI0025A40B1D|nr:hypothetical protein [Labilibaculum sp. K2S]MDM8161830.1 hypothetical protein [Labilibaculum sp. K2S]